MADGRLRVDGLLTRTGVFEYRNGDGSLRREYRDPAEVFSETSLESFEGVPVTVEHPPTMVNAGNAKQYAVGTLQGTPRQDGDHVLGTMIVFDGDAVSAMERGKVAVSCGYECDLVEVPGVSPTGEKYDARQTNIRGNHVAIVSSARAGQSARVRMDASVMVGDAPRVSVCVSAKSMSGSDLRNTVTSALRGADVTVRAMKRDSDETTLQAQPELQVSGYGGVSVWVESTDHTGDQLTEVVTAALSAASVRVTKTDSGLEIGMDPLKQALEQAATEKVRADQAEAKVKTLEASVASQTARADVAEKASAAAEKARTDAAEQLPKLIDARVALQAAAAPVLNAGCAVGAEFKFEGTADKAIKIAVVKKIDGDDLAADAHDEYVNGRYFAAIKQAAKGSPVDGLRRAAGHADSAPADIDDEATATRKARERADAKYREFATRNDNQRPSAAQKE